MGGKRIVRDVDTTQCWKCLYRTRLEDTYNVVACYYLVLTGKRRPCKPSPNCKVFEKFDVNKRRELVETVISGRFMS